MCIRDSGLKITWGDTPPAPEDITNLAKKVKEKNFRCSEKGKITAGDE